jgi:aspartyl-tRNA(Asn)/glutamyl-tRNA(Gln) amidotransferase subunit C
MTITPETVENVAKLARLALTPDEVQQYANDLDSILSLVKGLDDAELADIAVDLQVTDPTVFRPDLAQREFTRDELLANAPHEEEGFFRVPQILGDN